MCVAYLTRQWARRHMWESIVSPNMNRFDFLFGVAPAPAELLNC